MNYQQPSSPAHQLKTNRGLLKFILLSAITFGIYAIVVMYSLSGDVNEIASRYDGKKTMNFLLIAFFLGPITLEIATLIWFHNISSRIGNELKRRGIVYGFGAGSFWGWCVLGALIGIGPLVYYHKLFKAMNLLSQDYNIKG